MKNRLIAAPRRAEFSAIFSSAIALALSVTPSLASAQTMKVKGGMEYRLSAGSCKPLPVTAVKPVPASQARVATSTATKLQARTLPTAPAVLMPVASTTWNILPNNGLKYCVNAGVVNDGAGPSGVPLTLTLTDYRGSGDPSYKQEFPANIDGTSSFPPHIPAPPLTSVLTQTIGAHSAAAATAPDAWCTTLTDWRKRPHLQLTLTAPGSAQPVTCFVEFQETALVGVPQK